MKTGTTYVQGVLDRNRDRLAADGVLFPGQTWRHQVRAVQDVMGTTHGDPVIRAQADGAWRDLTRAMLRHRGPSIVSMEFLSHAGTEQARRVMSSLGEAEVHVVLTVRDAAAAVPAQWQTWVRNGSSSTWEEFRRGVRRADGRRARPGRFADPAAVKFRRAQDVAGMLEVWRRFVPPERLHVVTVPAVGRDRSVLWRRFSDAVGLDPELDREAPAEANTSLGYVSTELLRRVNAALPDAAPGSFALSDYNATVRELLAGRVLSARSDAEARPQLDRRTADAALAWNARTRGALAATGMHLVGDVLDLPSARRDEVVRVDDHQPTPSTVQLTEVAEEALRRLREPVAVRVERAARHGVSIPGEWGDVCGPRGGGDQKDRLGDLVLEIARTCRGAMEVRRRTRAATSRS